MKKAAFLIVTLVLLAVVESLSQTVYINQTGTLFHTNKCRIYAKSFEGVSLARARDVYRKKPCPKCKPPTKETKVVPKKKKAVPAKPKPKPVAAPAKK